MMTIRMQYRGGSCILSIYLCTYELIFLPYRTEDRVVLIMDIIMISKSLLLHLHCKMLSMQKLATTGWLPYLNRYNPFISSLGTGQCDYCSNVNVGLAVIDERTEATLRRSCGLAVSHSRCTRGAKQVQRDTLQ